MEVLDVRDLLGPRAVIVHVPHEGRGEHLAGALPAIGAAVQGIAQDRRRGARAGAADADLAEAVHGAEDHHALAHARLDQPDRHADQRLGRGAAAEHVHVEVGPDAEVAGDEGPEGRIAGLIRQHAVDVRRLQPRILDRIAHRPGAQLARGHARAARVGRLADAHDRIFVAQEFRTGGVGIRHRHGVSLVALASAYAGKTKTDTRHEQSCRCAARQHAPSLRPWNSTMMPSWRNFSHRGTHTTSMARWR